MAAIATRPALVVYMLLSLVTGLTQSKEDGHLFEVRFTQPTYTVSERAKSVMVGVVAERVKVGDFPYEYDEMVLSLQCTSETLEEDEYDCSVDHRSISDFALKAAKRVRDTIDAQIGLQLDTDNEEVDKSRKVNLTLTVDFKKGGTRVNVTDKIRVVTGAVLVITDDDGGCVGFSQAIYIADVGMPIAVGVAVDRCDTDISVVIEETDTGTNSAITIKPPTALKKATLPARNQPSNFNVTLSVRTSLEGEAVQLCRTHSLVVVSFTAAQQLELMDLARMSVISGDVDMERLDPTLKAILNVSVSRGSVEPTPPDVANSFPLPSSTEKSPQTQYSNTSMSSTTVRNNVSVAKTPTPSPSQTPSQPPDKASQPPEESGNQGNTDGSGYNYDREEEHSIFMTWGLVVFVALLGIGLAVYIGYHNRDKLKTYIDDAVGKLGGGGASGGGGARGRRGKGPKYSKLPRTIHETVTHDD